MDDLRTLALTKLADAFGLDEGLREAARVALDQATDEQIRADLATLAQLSVVSHRMRENPIKKENTSVAGRMVLMPKATSVWLVENTTLTFDQISAFTGLHPLEVQAIADGVVAGGMTGFDPTVNGQLTKEEIKRVEADPAGRLKLSPRDTPMPQARSKGPRYTPVAKRQDRPDAIAWLLKVHPELQDSQVAKLVGSTKSTVQSVKDRSHWNMQNVRPRDPVTLGLCSLKDLNDAVDRARRKAAREDAARKSARGAKYDEVPSEENDAGNGMVNENSHKYTQES